MAEPLLTPSLSPTADGEHSPERRRRRRRQAVVDDEAHVGNPLNPDGQAEPAVEDGQPAAGSREVPQPSAEAIEVPPDLQAPPPQVTKESKLEAKDHVLITVGPAAWLDDPQPHHGGRPDHDRFGLDERSTCVRGPFRKPWMRVPKGGCIHIRRRQSTDKIIWYIMVALWVVILFVGTFSFFVGDIDRLRVGGVDFMGLYCGSGSGPRNEKLLLGKKWSDMKYLWFPIEANWTVGDAQKYAICVDRCPQWDPTQPLYMQPSIVQYAWDRELTNNDRRCCRYHYCPNDEEIGCLRRFRALYPSTALHNLCVPNIWSRPGGLDGVDPGIWDTAQKLVEGMPMVHDSWFRFTAEIYSARYVLGGSGITTFICGEVFLRLLKTNPLYVAWGSVLVLLATTIATGVLIFKYRRQLLDNELSAKYDYRKRHEWGMLTLGWVLLIIGILNGTLCLLIRKKVVIAAQMMGEANKVLKESPGMSFVAPWTWLIQIVLMTVSLVVFLFVGTIGTTREVGGLYTDIARNSDPYHVKGVQLDLHISRAPLQTFLVVVFLWTMGLINIMGYFITSFISVLWYFSVPSEPKQPPKAGMPRAMSALPFHLGSFCIGAFILIFLSIRMVLDKIQEKLRLILEKITELHWLFRYVTCLAHYTLLLFDKFIKLIRRDAYSIQCIEGQKFGKSAHRASKLYEEFWLHIHTVAEVSENVALFGRLAILSTTVLVAFLLLTATPYGEDGDNIMATLVVIIAAAFFIATLYVQIANSTMDSFLMCYCYDMEVNDGSKKRPYFTHKSFRDLIDQHKEVRNEYRNIGGTDFLLTGVAGVQALAREARMRMKDTAIEITREAEQRTKRAASLANKTARKVVSEAEKTAKKGTELTKQAAARAERAARETASHAEKASKVGLAAGRAGGKGIELLGKGMKALDKHAQQKLHVSTEKNTHRRKLPKRPSIAPGGASPSGSGDRRRSLGKQPSRSSLQSGRT